MTLTVYTAASIRHRHAVRMLHSLLRKAVPGIQILDWTEQSTPPDGLNPALRREWFDADQQGGQVFEFCRDACQNADIVIYLGQSGQDAGIEVGLAHASNVPVIGLAGPLEAPGLMLHGCVDLWVNEVTELVDVLHRMSVCDNGICTHGYHCPALQVCPGDTRRWV